MLLEISSVSVVIVGAETKPFQSPAHCCDVLPHLCRKAKMMLDDIVSRGRGGPPGQFHDNANGQNGTVQEIMIPAGKAGLVIGKGGETIKQLQVRGRL